MATVNTDEAVLYPRVPQGFSLLVTAKVGQYAWRTVETFKNPWQTVPPGFTFNGASVPRALWSVIDPAGEAFEAACVHDYLYQTALKTKEYADKAFHDILIAYGVDRKKAYLAYRMVRRFGKGMYQV